MPLLHTVSTRALAVATRLQPVALLLARAVVGVVFLSSGWGKLHGLDNVIEFFRDLGIPFPELQAPFVATVELVGGALMLLGLGTRLAAIPLTGTMLVAIATAKWKDVAGPTDLLFFSEVDYIAFFALLATFGPGALSLDALIGRWRSRRTPAPGTPEHPAGLPRPA
jgi:putative oxidoreductase